MARTVPRCRELVIKDWRYVLARSLSSSPTRFADEEPYGVSSVTAAEGPGLHAQALGAARQAVADVASHEKSSLFGRHSSAQLLVDPRLLNPNRDDRRRRSLDDADAHRDGWFAIGIYRSKHLSNHGTLWRTAWHLGAAYLFTIGDRLGHMLTNADTSQGWQRLPSFRFSAFDEICSMHSGDTALIAVEMGGEPLEKFRHPAKA